MFPDRVGDQLGAGIDGRPVARFDHDPGQGLGPRIAEGARGANRGGEQSGHPISLDDFPTGDGILPSLRMLEVMAERGGTLASLVEGLVEFPQTLVNVRVSRKPDFAEFPEITAAAEVVRAHLGRDGRIDLRYSGTEPLARIMVEARDRAAVDSCAKLVADAVRKHLGEK